MLIPDRARTVSILNGLKNDPCYTWRGISNMDVVCNEEIRADVL